MCISTQQLVRDWDKSYSSGIWDGKNDSTIGNEMVKVSGQAVGSGTGERVSKPGMGWEASGQLVGREVGREQFILRWDGKRGNRNQERERSGNIGRERKYRNRSRSRTVPDHFSRPDLYRAEPCSRAYAFGREMVCSQKSVRNRNFFENAGYVSFSFCQTGSAETSTQNHAKPAHRVRRSSGQPFTGTTRSAGVGGFGLALAILVGLAKKWCCAAFLYISCQPYFTT